MSKLSFVPLGGALVPIPGELTVHGQQPRRLCARVGASGWEFTGSALSVEAGAPVAAGLVRMAMRGDIAPADAETAAACGVAFAPVEFVGAAEGWRVKTTAPKSRTAAKE